jgi:hypothetical protein
MRSQKMNPFVKYNSMAAENLLQGHVWLVCQNLKQEKRKVLTFLYVKQVDTFKR